MHIIDVPKRAPSNGGVDLPTAVVVGLEANGLGAARALARHGIPCIALAGPRWNPCFQTNTCTVVRSTDWTAESLVQDLLSIGRTLRCKAPLLLTKDRAVVWVSEAREELTEFYEIALPPKPVVDLLMSKVEFIKLAQREQWPIPLTWIIESKDELAARLAEITYPSILKPQVKNDVFRRYSPKKAFRVTTRDELIQTYEMVCAWEKEVVVQEWIAGGDDRVGFCLTYSRSDAQPLAMFPGRKLIQWPVGWGNTAVSEPAPEEWATPLVALTRKIWENVGYVGLGSMEYKFRPGSNTPTIMEPTVGRTDFQSELAVLNGVNIPAIAYSDLAGLPPPPSVVPSRAMKLIDGPSHLHAARVFVASPDLRVANWIKARRGYKRYMIARAGDYGPFLGSIYSSLRSSAGDILQWLLGNRLKQRLTARAAK